MGGSTSAALDGPESFVNLARYPIDQYPPKFLKEIETMTAAFRRDGVLVLDEFIAPARLQNIISEAEGLAPLAFHNELVGNAYLEDIDPNLPEGHPKKMVERTSLGAVAYDQIPESAAIRKVYEWEPTMDFVSRIVCKRPLYHYACPMGALNIAVMKDGDYLRWHFDQSDFVVSINLQDASDGGYFEYCHNIRTPGADNFESVASVLKGDRTLVKRLHAKSGSMILFQGRYTMHRVTPILGSKLRLMALLGYVDQPGVTSTEYLRKIRYGRT